jgi:acetyltransferase-like isoleucine patch superfamily enzyme
MIRLLLKIPVLKQLHYKGLLSKAARRNYAIYWVLRLLFGLNKECKFSIHFTSTAIKPENIEMGEGVEKSFLLSGNCYYQAINGIKIGANTIIAPGVKLISANHEGHNLSGHVKGGPIIIGKNCWIGANAVVLPGVVLGDHTIVAAGAVVTKSFPMGNEVLMGVPAVGKVAR